MAISKKGKRKLVRYDRIFYWYMKETDDWMHAYSGPQLHVVSDDRKFLVSYQPGQQNENPFLIIKGREYEGLPDIGGPWVRVKVPHWEDKAITPGFVRRLIDWCLEEKDEIVLVDYLGKVTSTPTRMS